ncbi:hypothetical protein G9A89_008767 [Geosiphon pyriformis]|nr:hypothetical protein G9A89_008767 [Geosiphon pyriformis]
MPKYNEPDYPEDDFFTDDPDKQKLANLNTKLCNYCLILCYFQYCNKCNLMLNLPPRILFLITKLPEPEEEVLITKDMLFQDSTENTKTEQYLVYLDLFKELKLKWYSNNEKRICLEKAHDTDAAPHFLVKIDLKIVLEIPVSTIVQVASRSSLAKKEIDKHHHDATEQFGQTLQNRMTRKDCPSYLLTPSQNTPINPSLTARGINGSGSSERRNVPVNFMEKDNNQIQDQALLFEASPEICSLADIANLYLLAKAHKHFKIPIHNLTEDVIKIPEGTLVSSISTDIQNPEKPQSIPDFAQLFLFCDIILQVWNLPKKSYLFTPEKINKLNLGNLSTLQQIQFKVLLNQYADVFVSENKFGRTNIVKHQIDTEDARLIKQ